jgi:hypothetical protein
MVVESQVSLMSSSSYLPQPPLLSPLPPPTPTSPHLKNRSLSKFFYSRCTVHAYTEMIVYVVFTCFTVSFFPCKTKQFSCKKVSVCLLRNRVMDAAVPCEVVIGN